MAGLTLLPQAAAVPVELPPGAKPMRAQVGIGTEGRAYMLLVNCSKDI